jgi:hypothetical protein
MSAGPLLFGESRNKRVRESFAPFQILGHPSISLCESPLHEVRDIALAGTGQLGVFLCFSSIALCSFRFAFHFNIPPFTPADVNSEIGRPDEGDGAKARTNWARRAATDRLSDLGASVIPASRQNPSLAAFVTGGSSIRRCAPKTISYPASA